MWELEREKDKGWEWEKERDRGVNIEIERDSVGETHSERGREK